MDEDRQLNLFAWDRIKVGEGFSALATLDLAKAVRIGQGGETLRQGLIRRAIALVGGDCHFHRPPDVCLGRFLLEVDESEGAEAALRRLLERRPFDGRLWVCLGNCLFRQGRQSEAGHAYTKAFLVAPWELELKEIDDKKTAGRHL